jgi:hypothetical protein
MANRQDFHFLQHKGIHRYFVMQGTMSIFFSSMMKGKNGMLTGNHTGSIIEITVLYIR